jgi:hypothetical protein
VAVRFENDAGRFLGGVEKGKSRRDIFKWDFVGMQQI